MQDAPECRRLVVGYVVARHEVQVHLALLKHYFLYAECPCYAAQRHHENQFHRLVRDFAETVLYALAERFHVFLPLHIVEFLIQQYAFAFLRNECGREQYFEVALDCAVRCIRLVILLLVGESLGEFLRFQFQHGFFQNLLVGLVAEVGDESALLRAEQVARAAYVEVLHRYVDSAAEVGEAFYGLKPPARHRRQRQTGRHEQIAERLLVATSHAAAQLVQLAQSEILGVVDYYCVDIRHIDARLDDCSGQQHVVLVCGEVDYCLLQFVGRHLPVSHYGTRVGDELAYARFEVEKLLYPVVDEESLSSTRQLEVDGFAQYVVVEGCHCGKYRVAVGRRSVDCAEVARSHQRELQGARYRRCRHRERIDIHFHLLQLLFHAYAELLFFIDYEQSEVFEFHSFANEFVCADDYVDFSGCKIGKYGFHVFGFPCAGQIIDPDREFFQARRECGEMLECQHCRRHEHCGLLAVGGCFESGAYRHFCLAKAYIAANQAVHRAVAFHIGFHGLCGFQLVGSVLIDERCLKFLLQVAVGRERKALFVAACGVEAYQVAGDVFQLALGAFLHLVPRSGAELVEPWLDTFLATVFCELVQRMYRHEYLVIVQVGELYHLLHLAVDIGAYQSSEFSHSVVDVYYVVAHFNLRQLFQ